MGAKVRKLFSDILGSITTKVIKANVNSCCVYIMYQSQIPKSADKYKKIKNKFCRENIKKSFY